jgi:hypothetical protein
MPTILVTAVQLFTTRDGRDVAVGESLYVSAIEAAMLTYRKLARFGASVLESRVLVAEDPAPAPRRRGRPRKAVDPVDGDAPPVTRRYRRRDLQAEE